MLCRYHRKGCKIGGMGLNRARSMDRGRWAKAVRGSRRSVRRSESATTVGDRDDGETEDVDALTLAASKLRIVELDAEVQQAKRHIAQLQASMLRVLESQHLMGGGVVSLNSDDEGISEAGEEGKRRGKEEEKGMETSEKMSEGSDAWDGIHA